MIETFSRELPHGITLHCRAAGPQNGSVLLFLHGFPEGSFIWDDMLVHFSQAANGGYRCIAPDLRGFGQSSQPTEVAAYRAKFLLQDIVALIGVECASQPLAALVAHDWGGAVAWNLANQRPDLMQRLVIINSPHPGAFLRELKKPKQQASSEYMNFLVRPDAEALLAEDDYRRLWQFFTGMGAGLSGNSAEGSASGPIGGGWLTEEIKARYRSVWAHGLRGGCNYYRASPLRPPTAHNPGATAVELPESMFKVTVPTLVIWGVDDIALPPELIEGLDAWIPQLTLHRVERATHWVIHEQPARVAGLLQSFLAT